MKQKSEKCHAYDRKNRNSCHNLRISNFKRSSSKQSSFLQTVSEKKKTIQLLGCLHELYGKREKFKVAVDMEIENYGSIWFFDQTIPYSDFNLLGVIQMKKSFNWIVLPPLLVRNKLMKRKEVNLPIFFRHEIGAQDFIKLKM